MKSDKFKHLELPEEETQSATDVDKWFVFAEGYAHALMVSNNELHEVFEGDSGTPFYFDTRLEAFEASVNYYNRHSCFYPHEAEWLQEVAGNVMKIANDAVESQVMEFV